MECILAENLTDLKTLSEEKTTHLQMAWKVCIYLLQVLAIVCAYNLTCPVGRQWKLRASHFCEIKEQYTCLLDTVKYTYEETCNGPRQEIEGFKTTLNKGNFDRKECSIEGYQPQLFSTDGNSNCVLQKSECTDEGQLSYDQDSESPESDRLCVCDYENGYALNVKSRDKCFCLPSEEDCSCYKKTCLQDELLTPRYECVKKFQSAYKLDDNKCRKITRVGGIGDKNKNRRVMSETFHNTFEQDFSEYRRSASIVLAVLLVLLIVTIMVVIYYKELQREKTAGICNRNKANELTEKLPENKDLVIAANKEAGDNSDSLNMSESAQGLPIREFESNTNIPDRGDSKEKNSLSPSRSKSPVSINTRNKPHASGQIDSSLKNIEESQEFASKERAENPNELLSDQYFGLESPGISLITSKETLKRTISGSNEPYVQPKRSQVGSTIQNISAVKSKESCNKIENEVIEPPDPSFHESQNDLLIKNVKSCPETKCEREKLSQHPMVPLNSSQNQNKTTCEPEMFYLRTVQNERTNTQRDDACSEENSCQSVLEEEFQKIIDDIENKTS